MSDEVQVNEVEQKAMAQGWVPKEDFRGPEEKWVDAETFIERGEQILPILKERNDKLTSELNQLKGTVSEFVEYHKKTAEREYERAKKELADKQAQAIENGDSKLFLEAKNEEAELDKQQAQTKTIGTVPPELAEFEQSNTWYKSDAAMTQYADMIGPGVAALGFRGKAFFDEVVNQVRARFPDKFGGGQPQARPAAPVEGGGHTPQRKKGNKRSFDDLPDIAKQQYEKFARMSGKDKDGNPKFTKEQYAKDYPWEKE